MLYKSVTIGGQRVKAFYLYDNYRKLLKDLAVAKKANFGKAFSFSAMARELHIQRTHLSAMLNERNHFNADQLFAALEFLELRQEEKAFISLLHQFETAYLPVRRKHLQSEIDRLRSSHIDSSRYVGNAATLPVNEAATTEFYLNIDAQLVHMFLTIDTYRTDTARIRSALGLTAEALSRCLQLIEKAGLIEIRDGKISVNKDDFHLSKDSAIYPYYRLLMRQKSLQKLQNDTNQYSFSVIFSADEIARRNIHQKFLEFIGSCKAATSEAKLTDVYQINFDLLAWSRQ
jgi:hypothetical protein